MSPDIVLIGGCSSVGKTTLCRTLSERRRTQFGRTEAFRRLDPERQRVVVEMNRLYSSWLRNQAVFHGTPWIESRPWSTLVERARTALGP